MRVVLVRGAARAATCADEADIATINEQLTALKRIEASFQPVQSARRYSIV
jgi:hypothetical protein